MQLGQLPSPPVAAAGVGDVEQDEQQYPTHSTKDDVGRQEASRESVSPTSMSIEGVMVEPKA